MRTYKFKNDGDIQDFTAGRSQQPRHLEAEERWLHISGLIRFNNVLHVTRMGGKSTPPFHFLADGNRQKITKASCSA